MSEIMLIKIIEDAMDQHGADGLWSGDGPCGCGRGDLNPGGCMSVSCTLAKSKIATEEDVDDCIEVGDTVWFPIQIKVKEYKVPTALLNRTTIEEYDVMIKRDVR